MTATIQNGKLSLGTFAGTVLVASDAGIGGYKKVFVHLTGPKASPQYPLYGGKLANPFPGHGKMYAGDLVEWRVDGTCYLLKTYEVSQGTSSSADTVIYLSSGQCEQGEVYRHIPFVGDNLMVAPNKIDGTGKGVSVVAVENTYDAKGKQTGWKVTLSAALGSLEKGAVLVEASGKGDAVKAMVTNPNCYLEEDYDCPFVPSTGDADYDGARYLFTPTLMEGKEYGWISKMSPLPKSVLALNTSKVPEWFKL